MKKLFIVYFAFALCSCAFADNFGDIKKQAEGGDAFAQYKVARAYATGDGVAQNGAEALKWAKLSAQGGNSFGQNMLGVFYLDGVFGLEKDIAKGMKLLENAAENGNLYAMETLAKTYCYGIDWSSGKSQSPGYVVVGRFDTKIIDPKKSFYWAQKAAEQNSIECQGLLSYYYYSGDAAEKDLKKALDFAQKAAEQNDTMGLHVLGILYLEGEVVKKDVHKAFELVLKSASTGEMSQHPMVLCNLACFYLNGLGTEKNLDKAMMLLEIAASMNWTDAQVSYSKICLEQKDCAKAFYWAQKAAQKGDAEAKGVLGKIYFLGLGKEKDAKKAFALFSDAAQLGNAEAMRDLAYLYLTGDGAEKNIGKALELYEAAAENGVNELPGTLALAYFKGEIKENPIERDFNKAFYWAQKASANKDVRGDKILAEIYLFGRGTEKNPQKAFEFCKKAADKGDIEAISNLASMYLLGEGTEKNLKKAFELHLKAAESGIVNSQKILALFYCGKYGDAAEKDFAKAQYWAEKAAANGDFDAKMLLIVIRNKDNPGKVKAEMEKLKETQGKTFTPKQINFIDNFIKNVENSAKK